MDRVAIADLELELGCLEVAGESSSLRQDHGDSDIFFDAPRDVTSRLEPPSKTKSIYTFGIDGTIAWVTPAGELLQVASCIKSRLIGVEYKKTIERGEGYNARGKLLERAVESAHGSGYGIGLSLAQGLEPYSVCWVHNRWPRFSFRYNDLDIRLQYYVEGNSVIQQYQIRNDAKVQADLPYSISSDICFREHRPGRNPFHVVPTEKSQERLLLFQNSEVLVRNTKFKAQYRTTTFLNTQRFSAWAVNPVIEASQEDDEEEEDLYLKEVATKQLANTISADGGLLRYDDNSLRRQCTRFYNRAPGRKQPEMYRKHNFAQSRSVITIPGESTQELCTVLEVSDLPLISDTPTANLQRQKDKEAETQKEKITEKVNHMQRRLTANANHSVLTSLDAANSPQMPQFTEAVSFINEHLRIAKACTKVERLGEARYHYWVACLIAEVVYNKKAIPLSDIRFQYAKFLHENGWHDAALKIMRDVYQYRDLDDIMNQDPKSRELTRGIRYRLASMYLEDGLLTEAGDIFDGTWSYFNKDMTPPDLNCYSFLERAAWTQVCQNKHEKAYESYSVLLNQRSLPRRIMLCNLAFVRRKTGYFQEAESLYRSALHCSDSGTTNATDDMITRSGLFACLRGLGKHAESDSELKSLRGYVDVNSRITLSPRFESPFDKAEFQFTMTRHLETLLSVYSIPILGEDGTSGNAFVDGDPLKCINDSSGA
ncbi:uncharacterized protein KY384_008889 [Bacidia gigantensis]|uniref:uncharacterized protein n=1 Tax=Bacidia gigantensis TaxID=2732470 RepID=UPI001D057C56|nr:uncharacterized protein KY384_008889 [Bacidia gigantensis]KAG8525245.1 hypothetical protein KY384_008889 [Bacidia gigantensis]